MNEKMAGSCDCGSPLLVPDGLPIECPACGRLWQLEIVDGGEGINVVQVGARPKR